MCIEGRRSHVVGVGWRLHEVQLSFGTEGKKGTLSVCGDLALNTPKNGELDSRVSALRI